MRLCGRLAVNPKKLAVRLKTGLWRYLYVARMGGWDERVGRVSRSFDEWKITDGEIRAFYRFTSEVVHAEYEKRWIELGEEPADPDGPDMGDAYHDRIQGLWPADFDWMLYAAAWKDAVTAYEVYVEHALDEVLRRHGQKLRISAERGPTWGRLAEFYKKNLDLDVSPVSIRDIRNLRHVLTHNRGEWRSEGQRQKLNEPEDDLGFTAYRVQLTRGRVEAAMDVLAAQVRTLDQVVWLYAWGRSRLTPKN